MVAPLLEISASVIIVFVILIVGGSLLSYWVARRKQKKRHSDLLECGLNKDLAGFKAALANKNADVNAINLNKFTPLILAVSKFGQKGITEELLKKGAYIDWQDINGDTALHYAASGGKKSIIKLLVEKGANKSLTNEKRETPLDIVQQKNKQDLIDLLS